jgi:CHAD domain-containing protein
MTGYLLTSQQRQRLEEQLYSLPDILRRRARLLLLYDEGLTTYQAAQEMNYSRSQARHWKHQFQTSGFAILPGFSESDSVDVDEEPPLAGVRAQPGLAAGEPADLPYPLPLKSAGILADDLMAEAGRKVWLFLFAEMLSHEDGTRLGENIEDLHDMRVATRRMRSAFDIFEQFFKAKALKPHLKGLRLTGRALGRVRDLDVLLEKVEHYQLSLGSVVPGSLELLLDAWRQQREAARQQMLVHLGSQAYRDFKLAFNRFVQTPGMGMLPANPEALSAFQVRDVVPMMIYERLAAVRAYDAILDNASFIQLHALRIEFKKLRYTVEYFREVLGEEARTVINDLKQMQDHLGDLHDADVACQLLGDFLKIWEDSQRVRPLAERQNPEAILAYLAYQHTERHRLLVTFPQAWAYFNRPEFRQNLAQTVAGL